MSNYENQLIADRQNKLEKLVQMGIDPYGEALKETPASISQVRRTSSLESPEKFHIAGRIVSRNNRGKLKFFFIQDMTDKMQIMCSKANLPDDIWEIITCIEVGDIIAVTGKNHTTQSGELSIFVEHVQWLTKSMALPPEKHHKIQDEETLQRQRYLDLIYTEGSMRRLLARSNIVSNLRRSLGDRGFYEVETPILQSQAGGAAARPFKTHHNSLDHDFNLRIALELHLKRLLVGGVEKVYEIGRVFRNEGIDQSHNPEFTMLELYQAYGDYHTMEKLLCDIICDLSIFSDNHFKLNGTCFEYDKITFCDLFYQELGIKLGEEDVPVFEILGEHMRDNSGDLVSTYHAGDYVSYYAAANYIFDKVLQPKLIKPTFVCDYPSQICPLTKRCKDPRFAERFEFFVNGMEIANAYTELNDPKIQEENFKKQLELSADERMGKMDDDFINALKVGMPPAGGIGIGIDRLCMLLLDCDSIRDIIAFPTLRDKK